MDANGLFAQAAAYTEAGLRDYGYTSRRNLNCEEIRDATVTRRVYYPDRSYVGAVYDDRDRLLTSKLRFNEHDIFPVDSSQLDDLSRLSAEFSPYPRALYGGILFPILGHFFFESLARLWPLLWQTGTPPPVVFHPWPMLDMGQFLANQLYRETFQAFGISPDKLIIVDGPVRFDTLMVPAPASVYHKNLDQRMGAVFDRVTAAIIGGARSTFGNRHIYLSRSRWMENRRIKNEEEIDALMSKRGFEIVHTELLSPSALLITLQDAAVVVATDGSHAHLAVFCRPGIKTVLLDTRPVPTQFAISALRGFKATHVPLFQSAIYRMEVGITDPALLGEVIDLALA